jgi:hypothetical protein
MPYALFHWGSGESCGTTFRASRGATCCPAGHCSLPVDGPGLGPRLRDVLQHGVGNGQRRAKGHKQRRRSPGGSTPRSHDLWRRPGFSLRQEARSGTESRRRSFPIIDFEIVFRIPSGIASGFLCLNSCQKKMNRSSQKYTGSGRDTPTCFTAQILHATTATRPALN